MKRRIRTILFILAFIAVAAFGIQSYQPSDSEQIQGNSTAERLESLAQAISEDEAKGFALVSFVVNDLELDVWRFFVGVNRSQIEAMDGAVNTNTYLTVLQRIFVGASQEITGQEGIMVDVVFADLRGDRHIVTSANRIARDPTGWKQYIKTEKSFVSTNKAFNEAVDDAIERALSLQGNR